LLSIARHQLADTPRLRPDHRGNYQAPRQPIAAS
jgi:hypothetical protein